MPVADLLRFVPVAEQARRVFLDQAERLRSRFEPASAEVMEGAARDAEALVETLREAAGESGKGA